MNIDLIKEKYNKHKNELVLYYFEVVRFVEIIYNKEDDEFYYLLDKGDKFENLSVLLPIFPLKNCINNETYTELKRIWNINYNNKVN
jgi:hypothetical protein